jgi:hypothetical protein
MLLRLLFILGVMAVNALCPTEDDCRQLCGQDDECFDSCTADDDDALEEEHT